MAQVINLNEKRREYGIPPIYLVPSTGRSLAQMNLQGQFPRPEKPRKKIFQDSREILIRKGCIDEPEAMKDLVIPSNRKNESFTCSTPPDKREASFICYIQPEETKEFPFIPKGYWWD